MSGLLSDLCIWRSTDLLIKADRWRRWGRMLNHSDNLTSVRLLFSAYWRERAENAMTPGQQSTLRQEQARSWVRGEMGMGEPLGKTRLDRPGR